MNISGISDGQFATLRALIDRMAEARPDDAYLLSPETDHDWSFREFRQQSRRVGQELLGLGLGTGDKVAFMMDNGLFTAGLFFGAMYGGFVPVPLNVRAGQSQLTYVLGHSDAKVVFVSDAYYSAIEAVRAEVGRELMVMRTDEDHGPWSAECGSFEGVLPEVRPGSRRAPDVHFRKHRTAQGSDPVASPDPGRGLELGDSA